MARVLHHYLAGMNIIHIDGFDTFSLEKVASFFKHPNTAIAFYLLSSLLSAFYDVNLRASSVIVFHFSYLLPLPLLPVDYSRNK